MTFKDFFLSICFYLRNGAVRLSQIQKWMLPFLVFYILLVFYLYRTFQPYQKPLRNLDYTVPQGKTCYRPQSIFINFVLQICCLLCFESLHGENEAFSTEEFSPIKSICTRLQYVLDISYVHNNSGKVLILHCSNPGATAVWFDGLTAILIYCFMSNLHHLLGLFFLVTQGHLKDIVNSNPGL